MKLHFSEVPGNWLVCRHCEYVGTRLENARLVDIPANKAKQIAEMREHLATKHKIVVCDTCDKLISKSSLSSHRKSKQCSLKQEKKAMSEQGLINVPSGFLWGLEKFLSEKKSHLLKPSNSRGPLESVAVYSQARLIYVQMEEYFHKMLGLKKAFTRFSPGGWGKASKQQLEVWISVEMYEIITLANRVKTLNAESFYAGEVFTDEVVSVLSDYHEHPERRESIRGILELAAEV